jgi:F0F1-type ATP synthase membrane subunit c/vacuolar-type H+-ATPase subunit K
MARSLVVKHEEKLGTSPLLNAFLVVALGWMLTGVLVAYAADGAAGAVVSQPE